MAAALAIMMGFLAPAPELGGILPAWTKDYVYLVYELTHDPPPGFATRYRMPFNIEFSTRPDGTHQAHIELEGEFPAGPLGGSLDRVLSIMLHSPMMGLQTAYLDAVGEAGIAWVRSLGTQGRSPRRPSASTSRRMDLDPSP